MSPHHALCGCWGLALALLLTGGGERLAERFGIEKAQGIAIPDAVSTPRAIGGARSEERRTARTEVELLIGGQL